MCFEKKKSTAKNDHETSNAKYSSSNEMNELGHVYPSCLNWTHTQSVEMKDRQLVLNLRLTLKQLPGE